MTVGSELTIGTLIADRYDVTERIGEGGMQVVYAANDRTFDRTVAVKVPKNASAEKRFKRSAILSASVNHPNVAKTLDYIPGPPKDYLVEEFVTGEDLRNLADRYYRMDPFLAGHILHHLAKGVAASHHVGVIHRDLKPSNIMVTREPWPSQIKITDFGIAKMAEEELVEAIKLGVEKSITTSATFFGALPYMSPEFIEDTQQADKPADVWAVGAIAYELMSGEQPFGSGLKAVPKIVAAELPKKPDVYGSSHQFGSFVDELWRLIELCLRRAPADRLTADALVKECEGLCYSVQARELGTIDNFGDRPGAYGFIRPHAGPDVFFHQSSYYGSTPKPGEPVVFAAFESGARRRAHPVVPLKP